MSNCLLINEQTTISKVKPHIRQKRAYTNQQQDSEEYDGIEWTKGKNTSTYYWNATQNKRYIKFLKVSGHLLLLTPQERKEKKVNIQMSKIVKTRTSSQCHTHHQKMIKHYGSIQGIIEALQNNLSSNKQIKKLPVLQKRQKKDKKEEEPIINSVNFAPLIPPSELLNFCLMDGEQPLAYDRLQDIFEEEEYRNDKQLLAWIEW